MTSKERVLATIRGERVDRIPVHHLQFSGDAAHKIVGRECLVGGAFLQWKAMHALWNGPDAYAEYRQRCEEDALAVARACGHDIVRLQYWAWNGGRPTRKIDDYNFIFGDEDGQWLHYTYDPQLELLLSKQGHGRGGVATSVGAVIAGEPNEAVFREEVEKEEALAASYVAPDGAIDSMKAQVERYPDELVKLGGETVYIDMDSSADLLAIALWPELVARRHMASARHIARDIPRLARSGMQVNFTGWDFCSNQGPVISPQSFREVLVPALRLITDACHANGMYYFYSGDGNFWPIADEFFNAAGVDGYFEVDRSAGMELRPLRQRFPRTTFIGNIRVQVLHLGTKEQVKREVMDCLEVAHELGGIIVGASNMIMPGTPLDNIRTMLDVIEKNR